MNEEIWKDIEGYEGIYQISNKKRIKSLERLNEKGRYLRERIMKTPLNGKYKVVTLRKNEIPKNFYIDKLYYLTFKLGKYIAINKLFII